MVPQWVDRLIENDTFAAIGAALVAVILLVLIWAGAVPAEHSEAAGALAAAASTFSLAAFRRAGAPKRRELNRAPEQ